MTFALYYKHSFFRLLVTTSADQTAKIWRTCDFTLLTELKRENQRWVWDAAFSSDSQYIFTGKKVLFYCSVKK